jgi:cathepsin L
MKIQHTQRGVLAIVGALFTLLLAIPAPAQINQTALKQEQLAPLAIRQKLMTMRQRIKARNLTYQVGYTEALKHGARRMTGGRMPANFLQLAKKQNAVARQVLQLDREARAAALLGNPQLRNKLEFKLPCVAGAASFDWRKLGKVTPVKTQGCGSCWAYGPMATLESSYLIRNNLKTDGSEQFIVSNSGAGNCVDGGSAPAAIAFLAAEGTTTEAEVPDSGTNGTPSSDNTPTSYRVLTYGFANELAANPTTAQIKNALCEHGPVVSWVGVTDSFMGYTEGTYQQDEDYATQKTKTCPEVGLPAGAVCGHYVTIIGWDDAKNAWLIKNSWGTNWGIEGGFGTERGYMWIDYGANEIGAGAMWVEARNHNYRLPNRYLELVPQKRIDLGPTRKGIILQKN